MITFAVSDVRDGEGRLPATTLEESLRARSNRTFEAAACNLPDLCGPSTRRFVTHAFVAAAHMAFDRHHPLVLSPDDVWLCLAQGFATHVNLHADALRGRFVHHEGKAKLTVQRDDFVKGSPSNDWPAMFFELSERIREHVGNKRDLVVANFSTTGPVEQAASEVVLFDALQSYFEYETISLCGIPEITLLGTPDDWLSIQKRAEAFAEFDLKDWTKALRPVLRQILRTAQGDVDRAFWQSFYKLNSHSGGPFVTGWINVLFPYVEAPYMLKWSLHRSGQVIPEEQKGGLAYWNHRVTRWDGAAHTAAEFPTGLSSAPFSWKYLSSEFPMVFTGGFVGVSQNAGTGAVRPAIGWAIGER